MNGKDVAVLLRRFNKAEVLTDDELETLREGLKFLHDFNFQAQFSPEALYYGMKKEDIKRIQAARKEI
jgi:hypothetical protein